MRMDTAWVVASLFVAAHFVAAHFVAALFVAALLAASVLGGAGPAAAQAGAGSCPPPLKFAAGACVVTCPGGYEDQGRVCVYRSLSR